MGWVKGSDRNFKASQTERYRKTKKDRRERRETSGGDPKIRVRGRGSSTCAPGSGPLHYKNWCSSMEIATLCKTVAPAASCFSGLGATCSIPSPTHCHRMSKRNCRLRSDLLLMMSPVQRLYTRATCSCTVGERTGGSGCILMKLLLGRLNPKP